MVNPRDRGEEGRRRRRRRRRRRMVNTRDIDGERKRIRMVKPRDRGEEGRRRRLWWMVHNEFSHWYSEAGESRAPSLDLVHWRQTPYH